MSAGSLIGGVLGAGGGMLLGIPPQVGYAGGSAIGGLVGNAVAKEKTPISTTRYRHPNLAPQANFTSPGEKLGRPVPYNFYPEEKASAFSKVMDIASPALAAGSQFLLNDQAGGGLMNPNLFSQAQPVTAEDGLHMMEEGQEVEVEGNELIVDEESHQRLLDAGPEQFQTVFQEIIDSGGYIPPTAPSHEEGGVDVNLPEGTYVLNGEHLAAIAGATDPQTKYETYNNITTELRGQDQVNHGLAKATRGFYSQPHNFFTDTPASSMNPFGQPAQSGSTDFFGIGQTNFQAPPQNLETNLSFMGSQNQQPQSLANNSYMDGAMRRVWEQNYGRTPLMQMGRNTQNQNINEGGNPTPGYLDDAMSALDRTSRMHGAINAAQATIAGREAGRRQPAYRPIAPPNLQSPTLRSPLASMKEGIKSGSAAQRSRFKDRNYTERLAAESNIYDSELQALLQAYGVDTDIFNQNQQALSQTMNMQEEMNMNTELMNRQLAQQHADKTGQVRAINMQSMFDSLKGFPLVTGDRDIKKTILQREKEMLNQGYSFADIMAMYNPR